MKDEQNKSQRY